MGFSLLEFTCLSYKALTNKGDCAGIHFLFTRAIMYLQLHHSLFIKLLLESNAETVLVKPNMLYPKKCIAYVKKNDHL